jgi:hypothetical protein
MKIVNAMRVTCALIFIPLHLNCSLYISPETTFIVKSQSNDLQTRKKHFGVSNLLNGLAQTCNQTGQLIVAEDKKQKQQAALNILGTALSTAANVITPPQGQPQQNQPQPEQQTAQQPDNSQLATKLAVLAEALLHEHETEPVKGIEQLPLTMSLIKSLKNMAQKEAFIEQLLSSPTTAKQFIKDLFDMLELYAKQNLPALIDFIQENILQELAKPNTPTTEPASR